MKIEVSTGEVLDKLSILSIKLEEIKDTKKINLDKTIYNLYIELLQINKKLWNIEDNIRLKEKTKTFDAEFIELARSVYLNNDTRARIKKQINNITNSSFTEEKFYETY